MLFNFSLVPVEQVEPWGTPGQQQLHWFGLTDGHYWIRAGDTSLLEYSERVRERPGATRYCDYQVVRLYEDVLEMIPHVLEPVPPALVSYISGDGARAFEVTSAAWRANSGGRLDDDRFWAHWDASTTWIRNRTLDTLYLSPSTDVRMWSDASMVHIEWDNCGKVVDGVPAWSTIQGSFHLSQNEFMREVESFHSRLMQQMEQRIEQVLAGALRAEIQIDQQALRQEQAQRVGSLERTLHSTLLATDWTAVRDAILEIESEANRTS